MKDYILAKICYDAFQNSIPSEFKAEFYNLRPEFQEAWWAASQSVTKYIQNQNDKLSLGESYDAQPPTDILE